jgi:hypothetical protein
MMLTDTDNSQQLRAWQCTPSEESMDAHKKGLVALKAASTCVTVSGTEGLCVHLHLYLHSHKHIPSIQYQSKTAGYETCHNHQQYTQYNNIEIQNNITTHHNAGQ